MYDELVKHLRFCGKCNDAMECDYCEYNNTAEYVDRACSDRLMLQAADAIEELADTNVGKWIPVTERLPVGGDDSGAICENVCLLMDDGTVSCGWMNGITKKVYYLNARDDFVIKAPITRVTHWMPLPEPPKED